MLGQAPIANEQPSVFLQVEDTLQAASLPSPDVMAGRSTRVLWFMQGGALAALMLIAVSACGGLPLASDAHAKPSSHHFATASYDGPLFAPSLPLAQRPSAERMYPGSVATRPNKEGLRAGALPGDKHRPSKSALRMAAAGQSPVYEPGELTRKDFLKSTATFLLTAGATGTIVGSALLDKSWSGGKNVHTNVNASNPNPAMMPPPKKVKKPKVKKTPPAASADPAASAKPAAEAQPAAAAQPAR